MPCLARLQTEFLEKAAYCAHCPSSALALPNGCQLVMEPYVSTSQNTQLSSPVKGKTDLDFNPERAGQMGSQSSRLFDYLAIVCVQIEKETSVVTLKAWKHSHL